MTKHTTVQDEFKPFPKSKDNGNSHPANAQGKLKRIRLRKAVNESISVK